MKKIDFSDFSDKEIERKIQECKEKIENLQIEIEENQEYLAQSSREYGRRMQNK